ncbi:unnamed protein product [Gongylonema pulchrum]|nr:unnamed protein product [Gongylonema pulchrum]
MMGVSLATGQLSAQILGHAGRGNIGKAAAMSRATLVGAAAVAPFLVRFHREQMEQFDHAPLCYICALFSVATIPLVHIYGRFMHAHFMFLPRAHKA